MFGQGGNSSFGNFNTNQSSPFGQSAFGKPAATTSFGTGTAPVFGNNTSLFSAKPAGTSTGSLFGNTSITPAFGTTTTTQSFGGFGNTMTNVPIFGSQQNQSGNLFGTNTNTTSAFGQPNKTAFGFGQTSNTSLFGQPQQPAQQSTSFGQPAASATGLFSSGFGSTNTMSNVSGTGGVKFSPVTGTDTMIKNGVTTTISTRHHCITCMKEYESKSLEELRMEDYVAGRKGPAQGQTPGIFNQPTQTLPFGSAAPISTTSTTGFGAIGSGFGTTNQSGSLFSKPISGFGAPAATTATSAFAFNSPNTNTSLFNPQPKPFGTPTPNNNLFGTTNPTSTQGSVFGNTGTQNAFGSGFTGTSQNQSIGLFNQNKSAFNTPASTSTSFGFGQTPATNTGNLFGGKPAATSFGTPAFGSQQTPGFQTNTSGFGSTLQNNNPSIFNTSFKPVGQTPGFGFGNTASSTTTGIGTNTGLALGTAGNSIFNSPAKSIFSGSGSNTSFNPTNTFGQTNTFGLGNNNLSTLGSNLFGGGANNSMFQQNSTSVPVHQQILALVSAPFGDSPLLKNLLPASGKADQLLKPTTNNNVNKTLNSSLYKVLPNSSSPKIKPKVITSASLSKKSMFEGLEDEDPLLEAFQPRPNAKRLVLRPKVNNSVSEINKNYSGDKQANNDSLIEDKNYTVHDTNATQEVNKENTEETNRVASNDRRSSNSWLISSLPRKTKDTDEELGNQNTPFCSSDIPEEFENTIAELRSQNEVQLNQQKNNETLSNISNIEAEKSNADISILGGKSSEFDDSSASLTLEQIPNKANVKLVRSSYYTNPPIDKLDEFVVGNTCIVPHFTVGRKGYGNVFYSESFDIYGLNLDEIVHFRSKEVIIYPDDNVKPPVGQGLNRRAQVTLDRVWPLDKSTHEPITDPQRLEEMDYEGKLRRVSAKHGTKFLDYRPETGSWVFKVDHFSKYGLSDSDDDDTDPAENTKNNLNQLKKVPVSNNITNDLETLSSELRQYASYNFDLNHLSNNSAFDKDEIMPFSPTSMQASILGTDSHKLQLMKASFFDPPISDPSLFNINSKQHNYLNNLSINELDESLLKIDEKLRRQTINKKRQSFMDVAERKEIEKILDYIDEPTNLRRKHKFIREKMKVLPPPVVRPEVTVLKYNLNVVPYRMSMVNDIRSKCIADLNVHRGRIFRASWGPNLTLISLCTRQDADKYQLVNSLDQLDSYIGGRQENDFSSGCIVQRFKIFGGKSIETDSVEFFCESVEAHLNAQLESCEIKTDKICPLISKPLKESSIRLLHSHKELAQKLASFSEVDSLSSYFRDVWKLCECLWGNLEELSDDEENNPYKTVVVRKQALSEWFKSVTTNIVFEEMAELEDDDQIIYSLLTGHKLEEACEKLRKNGEFSLALLVSQLGGSLSVRELIKQQIQLWQETNTIDHISINKFKMYMLIAAVPLIQHKDDVINICESLDWKRSFALHLWYLNSSVYSLTDILDDYESAFQSEDYAYTFKPYPEYFKDEFEAECCGRPLYDLCYQLLKLYCAGTYSLEAVINPQNHTYDPLDYRLSWFLMQVLRGLGYSHLSNKAITLTHISFATQLESYDLWHWAIFVILHLEDDEKRCKGVKDLLLKHVEIDKSKNYLKREEFLINKLNIPTVWINYSKATKALVSKRYGEAAWYFAHAEEYNKSHEIIINHIAAEAIINEEYNYIKELLNLLSPANNVTPISGWSYQGQLILDYMKVTEEIQTLLSSKDYTNIRNKLYSLESELTLMCSKINLFPCLTEKHILCQAEIAKRTFQLAKSLLMLHSNNSQEANFQTSNILSSLIKDLPLPEDYAQQELRPIINMCVEEIIKQ